MIEKMGISDWLRYIGNDSGAPVRNNYSDGKDFEQYVVDKIWRQGMKYQRKTNKTGRIVDIWDPVEKVVHEIKNIDTLEGYHVDGIWDKYWHPFLHRADSSLCIHIPCRTYITDCAKEAADKQCGRIKIVRHHGYFNYHECRKCPEKDCKKRR